MQRIAKVTLLLTSLQDIACNQVGQSTLSDFKHCLNYISSFKSKVNTTGSKIRSYLLDIYLNMIIEQFESLNTHPFLDQSSALDNFVLTYRMSLALLNRPLKSTLHPQSEERIRKKHQDYVQSLIADTTFLLLISRLQLLNHFISSLKLYPSHQLKKEFVDLHFDTQHLNKQVIQRFLPFKQDLCDLVPWLSHIRAPMIKILFFPSLHHHNTNNASKIVLATGQKRLVWIEKKLLSHIGLVFCQLLDSSIASSMTEILTFYLKYLQVLQKMVDYYYARRKDVRPVLFTVLATEIAQHCQLPSISSEDVDILKKEEIEQLLNLTPEHLSTTVASIKQEITQVESSHKLA